MNEVLIKSKMSRRRFFKKAARKKLFDDWFVQICAFIIVGAVFYGIRQFGFSLGLAIYEVTQNEELARLVISVFSVFAIAIIVPIFYGLVYFECGAISGNKGKLSDLFHGFSTGLTLYSSYDLFFGLIFRYAVYFLPAYLIYLFNTFVYSSGFFYHNFYVGTIDAVMFLLRTMFVISLYLGIVFSCRCLVATYISVTTQKETALCFLEAKKCLKGSSFEMTKLALSFFPLFVLSIFSVGFLFVIYTIPYMFITMLMFSKYLYDKRLYSIESVKFDNNTNINEFCE